MIRINLAKRKQAASVGDPSGSSRKAKGANLDQLKELPIRKIALPLLVGIIASHLFDQYREEEIKKLESTTSKINAEVAKLQSEMSKTKNIESTEKALEE